MVTEWNTVHMAAHAWVGVLGGVVFCLVFAAAGLVFVLYPKRVSDWVNAQPRQLVEFSPLYVRTFGVVFSAGALACAALIVAVSV